MNKELKYNGHTAQPSDYECPDGDLALSLGMVPENGSLHPVMPPKVLATWENVSRVFAHKNNFTHYVVVQNGGNANFTFSWCDDKFGALSEAFLTLTAETITDITAIGNMLIVASSKQMYYVLWRDGIYHLLGNEVPDINIAFALSGEVKSNEYKDRNICVQGFSKGGYRTDVLYVENNSDNFNAVMAVANKFVNDFSTLKGRFMFPFFVRYAIKLFDGSYAHISNPIFMTPNSGYVPWLCLLSQQTSYDNLTVRADAFIADLQMMVLDSIPDEWKDIITGVDIFVSTPIYPYDQGKTFNETEKDLFSYYKTDESSLKGLDAGYLNLGGTNGTYAYHDFYTYMEDKSKGIWNKVSTVMCVAKREESDIREDIESASNFYLIKSYRFEELKDFTKFSPVKIKEGVLGSLVNRQTIKDELLSGRVLQTGNLYAYNNRLHTFNASFRLSAPKDIMLHNQYVEPRGGNIYEVYVYLHTQSGTKIVRLQDDSTLAYGFDTLGLSWFYYPDNNAYKAVFVSKKQSRKSIGEYQVVKEIELTQHDFLNGAYWLQPVKDSAFTSQIQSGNAVITITTDPSTGEEKVTESSENVIDIPTESDVDDTVASSSTIYVSEVSNPFSFLSSMAVSVGCNNVIALATSAKPLSTGQFGKFPLYAFTDTGVWALETSSVGSYVARQPITRDICISADSICQLENSVLFATARGIMELSGSSANCITDAIKTQHPFAFADKLRQFDKLMQLVNKNLTADEKEITKSNISLLPFNTFVAGCRIINDYTNQRVIFYNPNVRYAYVLSRQSSQWGMMQSDCVMGVNSYPEAQAVDEDGNLLDFGQTSAHKVSALLVTRPFAMGLPDIHKTIDTIIQRGFFRKGNIGQILYASNDLFTWYPVSQSKDQYLRGMVGTPYKYFRLVIVGHIQEDESLYGWSVNFRQKLDNQLR